MAGFRLSEEQYQEAMRRYVPAGQLAPIGGEMAPVQPVAEHPQQFAQPVPVEQPVVPPQEAGTPAGAIAPPDYAAATQQYLQSNQAHSDALRAEGAVKAESAQKIADVSAPKVAEIEATNAKYAAELDDAAASEKEATLEGKMLAEQAANMRAVDRRSTGQKVMGVLALALSGIGDGLASMGGNYHAGMADEMMETLNQQIKHDYDEQVRQIQAKKEHSAAKFTEAGIFHRQYGETEHAKAAALGHITLKYAAAAEQTAAQTQNPIAKAQAESLAAAATEQGNALVMRSMQGIAEQKMRSRIDARKAGGGAAAGINLAEIQRKIDAGETVTPAELKAASTAGMFRAKQDTTTQAHLEELESTGDITVKQQATLNQLRAQTAKLSDVKDDTADQAKARLLYTSSATPAAALEDRVKNNRFPATSASIAEKLGIAPDEWNKEAALFGQEVESVANDLLRYESGASISTQETEGLVKRARSTDPDIRRAAIQRLIDKRNALKGSFHERPVQPGQVKPTGGETRQAAKPTGMVQFSVNGKVGSIPADKAAAFQAKYPNAQRL